jgi:F0F1-type ATP synthase membrane subunit b/b'
MDLNGTFFVELLIFGFFYYFVKSRIWPRFAGVLEERKIFIANGLQAAKEGQALLQEAHREAEKILHVAHERAQEIADHTHKEMAFFCDQIRQEMDEFKLNIQKEVLAECDQMRVQFVAQARAHYIDIASSLCEKVFFGHPDFCQKAIEEVLVQERSSGSFDSSVLN